MTKSMIFVAFLLIACMMIYNVSAFKNQNENPCICATTDELEYVCGSNGVTYPNLGALNCENQCKRSNIQLRHEGEC